MADVSRPSLIGRLALYARKMVGSTPPETVVVCPPQQMPAKLQLDPQAKIVNCTRLPADNNCERACATQLQYSPKDLSDYLREFEGRKCENCGKTIDASDWYASRANTQTAPRQTTPTPAHPLCFECWNESKV